MRALLRRIDVSPGFVAFLCAFYYFDPAQTFAPFLLSVALHEAAHLLVLRLLGAKIHRLRLAGSGAVIVTQPLRHRQEIAAAAAGPAANFLLLFFAAQRFPVLALINLFLLAYNLLPLYPLDGGRIIRAVLQLLFSRRTAECIERVIGLICLLSLLAISCYITCKWHAGLWPVLLCAVLLVRIAGTLLPTRRFLRVSG